MKKYLFIVLLVGVCFGQNTKPKVIRPYVLQLEDEMKEIRELGGIWKPRLKKLNEISISISELTNPFLAVVKQSDNLGEVNAIGDILDHTRYVRLRTDYILDIIEIFIIMDKELAKSYIFSRNKNLRSYFPFAISQIEDLAPKLKNPQGVYLTNKYIDLIKAFDKEMGKVNRMLLDELMLINKRGDWINFWDSNLKKIRP